MMHEIWAHYIEILTDPAHMLVEITMMIVVDGLVLGLAWPIVRKLIRREHKKIDKEHGLPEHD